MALGRNIHMETLAAIASGAFYPIVLASIDWPFSPVHVHSNVGDASTLGNLWRGIGDFGRVEAPGEATGTAEGSARLVLVGAPDTLDFYLDQATARGREVEIFTGVVQSRAGNDLIGEPFSIFFGTIDSLTDSIQSSDTGIQRVVTVSASTGPSQRSKAELNHTDEDQQQRFPGDTAFRHLIQAETAVQKLRWPE